MAGIELHPTLCVVGKNATYYKRLGFLFCFVFYFVFLVNRRSGGLFGKACFLQPGDSVRIRALSLWDPRQMA